MSPDARAELLAVPLCGPRVVERLESIGVICLRDLRRQDPYDLMERVNLTAGRPIWCPPMAIRALETSWRPPTGRLVEVRDWHDGAASRRRARGFRRSPEAISASCWPRRHNVGTSNWPVSCTGVASQKCVRRSGRCSYRCSTKIGCALASSR